MLKEHILESEDPSGFSSENEDENWSDWNSENVDITCLYCDYIQKEIKLVMEHMKEDHNFNFEEITKNLNFYQKVKIVNYVRKQMDMKKCIFCGSEFDNLLGHMREEDHFKLPPKKVWDQPE